MSTEFSIVVNVFVVLLNLLAVVLTIGRFSGKIEGDIKTVKESVDVQGGRIARIERWIDTKF